MPTWDEIDVEAREWRVPGERAKTGAEHRVPLSDAALAVIESVRPLRRGPSCCFLPRPRPAAQSLIVRCGPCSPPWACGRPFTA